MDVSYAGMLLASWALQRATINQLRGLGVLSDEDVRAIYDQALLALETQQAVAGTHSEAVEAGRRMLLRELAAERDSSGQ